MTIAKTYTGIFLYLLYFILYFSVGENAVFLAKPPGSVSLAYMARYGPISQVTAYSAMHE